MGLMKELNDLNAIYQKMNEGDGTYTVTKADKKANTPAWQGYKSGKKNVKTGKPLYKAADHLKDEVEDNSPVDHYLDELKKTTLASYAKKATTDLANRSFDHGESEKRQFEPDEADEKEEKKQNVRKKGIDRAIDKLAKEETDFQPSEIVVKLVESGKFSIDELWKIVEVEEGYQRDPEGGEEKERQRRRSQKGGDRTEKVRGERTPMPPRGDKRREDFERWYAANVR